MYTHVQHYQQAAAGMLRAKLRKQPVIEAFYRREMQQARQAIKQYKPAQL